MKTLLFALMTLSLSSFAGVPGLTIPNSHQVDKGGNVFRGRQPEKLVDELAHIGISDVIIFKNDVKGEVVKEIAELNRLGIKSHHIPFRWKQYPSMQEACEQIVEAISIIKKVKAVNGKVFLHCTAGEDRTGTVMGLYRMMSEKMSQAQVFRGEMCPRGFSDGNPHKPKAVTSAIEAELTPLFVTLAGKIEKGETLSKASCKNLAVVKTSLRCN
ncbi:MAG: dual specificity protein phosphatase family protein [Bdellovibrionota bacterium]